MGKERVGVIGRGSIGAVVADALRLGALPDHVLSGTLVRPGSADGGEICSLPKLIECSDLIVEAASQGAVAEYGPEVIEAGRDLLVLSVGALVDDRLRARLSSDGGGRLLISTGACGGIDVLRAAHAMAPLETVRLRTEKPSRALVREWMGPGLRESLAAGREDIRAFGGTAREAVELFPESANISALLALATTGFDAVEVELWGRPDRQVATHRISASGPAGAYKFTLENAISIDNPRTSAITGYSVLRYLADRSAQLVTGC